MDADVSTSQPTYIVEHAGKEATEKLLKRLAPADQPKFIRIIIIMANVVAEPSKPEAVEVSLSEAVGDDSPPKQDMNADTGRTSDHRPPWRGSYGICDCPYNTSCNAGECAT